RCRYAFAQLKHLPLPLRFRAVKTFAAAAMLSHRAKLPGASSIHSTYLHSRCFYKSHPRPLVMTIKKQSIRG
ncbi:hypothetical protein, partial [Lysinibacillus sphaericus]